MKTVGQLIVAAVFVFVVALVAGAITSDIPYALKLAAVVTAIVAPLTVVAYNITRFIIWWNRREIVRFRRAKRQIIRLRNRTLAKLERLA